MAILWGEKNALSIGESWILKSSGGSKKTLVRLYHERKGEKACTASGGREGEKRRHGHLRRTYPSRKNLGYFGSYIEEPRIFLPPIATPFSILTAASWANLAATSLGVSPAELFTERLAPISISHSSTCRCPWPAATNARTKYLYREDNPMQNYMLCNRYKMVTSSRIPMCDIWC